MDPRTDMTAATSDEAREPFLISIICSVHNADKYVEEAVRSVLAQDYSRWELLLGCDGCTDRTVEIVRSFKDARLRIFERPKHGLSATRNFLLGQVRGEVFCMFDGDDVMPRRSLAARAEVLMRDPEVMFADGAVSFRNADLLREVDHYCPSYRGEPLPHLLALDGRCFFGNTWMIRREVDITYHFDEELTHGEDLMFYISFAFGKQYDYTEEEVLWYRRTGSTLMSNLKGLENAYALIYAKVRRIHYLGPLRRIRMKARMIRFMALGYLKVQRSFKEAVRVAWRFLWL